MSRRLAAVVTIALATAVSVIAPSPLASRPPTLVPAAFAQDPDLKDSAADLIEDAKAALELARGWVRRADDANLEQAQRRDARVQAMDLLKSARGKLQAALELEPACERTADPVLTETMKLLAGVRKSSGIGEGGGSGAAKEPKGAPPPADDRPPTPREADAQGGGASGGGAPGTGAPGTPPTGGGTPKGGAPGTGTAPAPPTVAKLTVIPWEDWDRQYREITGRAELTTVAQLDLLRALAKDKAIEFRGKIFDIVPAPGFGDDATMLKLCGAYGGKPTRAFVVAAADRPAVTEWARWDRIVWRERIDVEGVDRIVYRPVYRGPSDLTRTPNPGVTYPRDVRAIDTDAVWQKNLRAFATAILTNRWRTAYTALRRAAAREYEIPGEIEKWTPEGAAVRPKGNQALETRDGKRFGPPRGTVTVAIDDPQIKAVAVPGTTVMLAFWLEIPPSARALYDARGEVTYRWRFHRLRAAGAK